jgi:hypothetical protein
MTRPDPNDPKGSTRQGRDVPASGTTAGDDVTSRMAGTDRDRDRTEPVVDGHSAQHATPASGVRHDDHRDDAVVRDTSRPADRSRDTRTRPAKTSAAATFALVFGLAALFCALTGILAPFAVLFGIIGLVLAAAGFSKTKLPDVTGKGVAIGGLVTALLGFVLGAAVLAGAAVYVNDQGLDRLEQQFDNARDNIPSGSDIRESVENTTN